MKLRSVFLACAGLAAILTGCREEEEIRRYQVARPVERLAFTLPDGWQKDTPARSPVREEAAFRIMDGNQAARVSVTILQGDQVLLDNVNRWRTQVGLKDIDGEELKKTVQQVAVAGEDFPYVDLSGPGRDGKTPQRTVGAIVKRKTDTWFFKMMGAPELVGKQKPAFEQFLRSVKINDGSTGASNG